MNIKLPHGVKIIIEDEMVDRAMAAGPWCTDQTTRANMRQSLEAALNPYAEPEIPVSEAMMHAGQWRLAGKNLGCDDVAAIYRAMERARLNEPKPKTMGMAPYREVT